MLSTVENSAASGNEPKEKSAKSIVKSQTYLVTERIYWITALDERVCEVCEHFEAVSLASGGWYIWDPTLPSIPNDSHPFCRCQYESGETVEEI
jgi:hypothetical protein